MNKKMVVFVLLMVLNLCGAVYAAGPPRGDRGISGLYSGSKAMSNQFSSWAAAASSRPSSKAVKTRSLPTLARRRAELQNTIRQLINFSRKASSNLRREVKKIKGQKNKRINKADIKGALDMADQFDRYAQSLQKKEKSLTDNDRVIDGMYQTMADMSQQLQLQLQDAMNKQQQAMQILSNIMKNQHDTLKSIINNLK